MPKLSFDRVAITAFLESGGFGPLYVWSLPASDIFELCARTPRFDPDCEIEPLLLGGCQGGSHPGREALEDHFRIALAHPDGAHALQSGSAMGRRVSTLAGASTVSLDLELGFLDLLIHAPSQDDTLPRSARTNPEQSMILGFFELWGKRPVFCGIVEEDDWDSYDERARAVLALLERAEIGGSSREGAGDSGVGSRRL